MHAHPAEQLMWYTLIHLAFVASALFLALIDRVSALTKAIGKTGKGVSVGGSAEDSSAA